MTNHLLQYFDTVGWVIRPVKTVGRITYTVLVQTLNHDQSINPLYAVSHNYGNPYEKWYIFVARPHLGLQLGMVKPEIILCETVLNLSTLNTLTYLLTYLLIS